MTAPAAPVRLGWGDALAFEWAKARTLPSTRRTLAATALLLPALALFVGLTASLQPDDTILGGSLSAAPLVQLLAGAFGALAITGEHGTGMIRTTYLAVPRRPRVVAAKAAVVAGLLLAVTVPAALVAHLVGVALLSGEGWATGAPFPALLGVGVAFAAIGAVGVAVGAVVRHTAGAVTAVVALTLLPALVAPLLGDLQGWVVGATPLAAVQKLAQTSDASADVAGSLGAWPSLGLLVVVAAAAVAGAARVQAARDV